MRKLPAAAALLLIVGSYARDAGAQVAKRAAEQRERARAALATEPVAASPARGDWYGWQTLTADALSLALFLAGGAEGTWRRRALAGGVVGLATATPIVHLVHRRPLPALGSALGRVIGSVIAHELCDSVGKTDFDISLGPSNPAAAAQPSKGFYRGLDDQLGPDFGAGTVCAGLILATFIALDAAALAYEPLPSAEPKQRPPNLRQPPARDAPRIVPKIMLDERGVPMAGLLVFGEL